MGWNYRVIRHEEPDGTPTYLIHEVYYEGGQPTRWCDANVQSETRRGLFKELAMISEGIAMPVLRIENNKLVEAEPIEELSDDFRKVIEEAKLVGTFENEVEDQK